MTALETMEQLRALAKESDQLSLGDSSPKKGQEFYLFRGTKECYPVLMSSIQVHLSENYPDTWREKIRDCEKDLLNRFLEEVEPFPELHDQYHWFCQRWPRTESFWYLSVMQHFGCPTRLCDFTSDFWMALFFASDHATEAKDLCLYRLKCKNDDEQNQGGNKCPKDSQGRVWNTGDLNELLALNRSAAGKPVLDSDGS